MLLGSALFSMASLANYTLHLEIHQFIALSIIAIMAWFALAELFLTRRT